MLHRQQSNPAVIPDQPTLVLFYSRATSSCECTEQCICHSIRKHKDHLAITYDRLYITYAGVTCENRRKCKTRQRSSYHNRQGVISRATAMAETTGAAITSARLCRSCFVCSLWSDCIRDTVCSAVIVHRATPLARDGLGQL